MKTTAALAFPFLVIVLVALAGAETSSFDRFYNSAIRRAAGTMKDRKKADRLSFSSQREHVFVAR